MRQLRTLLPAAAATVAVSAVTSQAQAQRRVTGVVTGEGGTPLAAASVQVVGTQTATYTTESGRFGLQAGDGTQTLRVRRIGYRARTVTLTPGQTDVGSVALERDVLQLEAQVVTGTATSISRANAANAISTVSADELVGRAPAQTIDNALQGKVAGAVISTNSGAPGGGSQVQLRGVSSINASSSPLYVVDGVLVSNQAFGNGLNSLTSAGAGVTANQDQQVNRIADLNPEDIESIEVLKGPSAGAIYGSKAANGVIVIRTKRGQNGRAAFNVRQRVGYFQLQKNRKLDLRCFSLDDALRFEGDTTKAGAITPGATAADLAGGMYAGCVDPQDSFYKADAPSYETTLGLQGGTSGGTTYYISGLAQRDNAIQRGTFYGKQSLSGNIGQTIGTRLTIQANNSFLHTLTDRGISGNDNSPVVSPVSVFSNTPTYFDFTRKDPATGQYVANPYLPGANGMTNPFQTATLAKLPQDVYRYVGSVNTTYNAYRSDRQTFDVTLLGGVDVFNQNNKIYSPATLYYEPADGLPGTIVNGDITSQFANVNLSGVHRYTASQFTAQTSFGLRREYRNSDAVTVRARNVPSGSQNIAVAGDFTPDEQRFRVHDLGFFAQEELITLGERLTLTGAINAERSSTNGDSKKFFAYPKASASYRVPGLPSAIDELKLRVAYGKAGNQVPFGYTYTALVTGVINGTLGIRPSLTAGNANLRPETSKEFEGGTDITFLKGRLGLSATLFRTDIDDLLLQSSPALSTGYNIRNINGGSFYKTGTELELNAVPYRAKNFLWTSHTTFSNFNSRITRLDVPGFAPSAGFSPRYGEAWVQQGRSITTARLVNGLNADGTFAYQYKESAPDFQMGFSNDVTFGRFRLAGLLDWRKGGGVANLTNNYFDATGLYADTLASARRLDGYTNGVPVYYEKATFLKLRELNLAYVLPASALRSRLGGRFQDLRFELSGRNLYTWAPYTGYDPEVNNFGNQNLGRFQDVTPYPPSRSYYFSVSTNF